MICIPTDRDIHSATVEAVFGLCANHAGGASFRTVRAHPTDRCRNLCVQLFLLSPHSHLLFIDSDVVPPSGCLTEMLAADREVVCGIYPLHIEHQVSSSVARKLAPNTYGFLNDLPDEPFEIDAAGMGCCLIERSVFERLGSPWFKFEVRPDMMQTGEDIYFFERCAEAGIRPLALPSLFCSHHRTVDLLSLFPPARERLGAQRAA